MEILSGLASKSDLIANKSISDLNDVEWFISLNFKCGHIYKQYYLHIYTRVHCISEKKWTKNRALLYNTLYFYQNGVFFEPLLVVFCKKDLKNEPVFWEKWYNLRLCKYVVVI